MDSTTYGDNRHVDSRIFYECIAGALFLYGSAEASECYIHGKHITRTMNIVDNSVCRNIASASFFHSDLDRSIQVNLSTMWSPFNLEVAMTYEKNQ